MRIAIILCLLPQIVLGSTEVTVCGEYTVKGIVRAKDSTIALVVNEKTFSEHTFKFPIAEMAKIALFLDQPVITKLEFVRKFNGYYGVADKVISVDMHYLDSINQDTKRIILNKKLDCLKI